MAQLIRPKSKIKIIPREGELEITLNIHITIEGELTGSSTANLQTQMSMDLPKEDEAEPLIPDFTSGVSLEFGKKTE